jgi:hypothetical protein
MDKWTAIRVSAILTILGGAGALLLGGSGVWEVLQAPPSQISGSWLPLEERIMNWVSQVN